MVPAEGRKQRPLRKGDGHVEGLPEGMHCWQLQTDCWDESTRVMLYRNWLSLFSLGVVVCVEGLCRSKWCCFHIGLILLWIWRQVLRWGRDDVASCLTDEKAQVLHVHTSPAESLPASCAFLLGIYGALLSWLGDQLLRWQLVTKTGFWCQAGTLLMPLVDGLEGRLRWNISSIWQVPE